jgi:nitrilase
MMADTLLAAAIQMCSGDDLQHNLARAAQLVGEAAQAAARFVALPEYFT